MILKKNSFKYFQKVFKTKKNCIFAPPKMVVVAQLVRALDCGSRGRGFKSHLPPKIKKAASLEAAFLVLKLFNMLLAYQSVNIAS